VSDRAGLAPTLALLVLALVAVTVLGGRATGVQQARARADTRLTVGETPS
jgi:hypothetical protein